MQSVLMIATWAVVAYLAVVLLAFVFQERLVFFPERRLVADPGKIGLSFEDVTCETADGVRIHGWFVPAPGASVTVLFLHGNAGNISHRLDTVQMLHELGADVLIIDYRGYGRSEGRPSESGTYRDADAAWRYLVEVRGVPAERIVVFGRSLGAAVAAELATRRPCGGVVLESAFTSVPDLGALTYRWLPVRWLTRLRYDTLRRVARIGCPKLIMHSPQDDVVPFEMGRALFAAAAPPRSFVEMRGGHNEGFLASGTVYREALRTFLATP